MLPGVPNHRYKMRDGFPHFMTCTIVDWLPVFRHASCARIALDSLAYLQESGALLLHSYVVMEDHLHLIGSGQNLASTMQRFSSFTARKLVKELGRLGEADHLEVFKIHCTDKRRPNGHKVWRFGSHPKAIRSRQMLRQKTKYIDLNPVRAGLVDEPADWPYSSLARLKTNDPSLPHIDPIEM